MGTVRVSVRDSVGFFLRDNTNFVDALVECPDIAKVAKQIVVGADMWARQRGLALDDVELEAVLARGNAFLVRIRSKEG